MTSPLRAAFLTSLWHSVKWLQLLKSHERFSILQKRTLTNSWKIKQTNNSERQPAFWLKPNLKSTVFLRNPRHHLSRPWSSPLRGTATNDFNYSGLTKTSSVYSMCFENYCFFSMTSIKELELHSQRDAFAHWSNTLKVYFSKKKIPL